MGMDIEEERSRENRYSMSSHLFTLPELKLLIDAVGSSKFITAKKSEVLIEKLSQMSSVHQAAELKSNLYVSERVKPFNEHIYYLVDNINTAINRGKQISFRYFHYDRHRKEVPNNDGKRYFFSPYCLVWNEDYYYAIGYSEKHRKLGAFRVDRMKEVEILSADAAAKPADFKLPEFNAINMFYKQIILQRGLPFEVKMPSARPVDISALSEAQMNAELEKGYADMQAGHTRSAKSVFADIRKDYNL